MGRLGNEGGGVHSDPFWPMDWKGSNCLGLLYLFTSQKLLHFGFGEQCVVYRESSIYCTIKQIAFKKCPNLYDIWPNYNFIYYSVHYNHNLLCTISHWTSWYSILLVISYNSSDILHRLFCIPFFLYPLQDAHIL